MNNKLIFTTFSGILYFKLINVYTQVYVLNYIFFHFNLFLVFVILTFSPNQVTGFWESLQDAQPNSFYLRFVCRSNCPINYDPKCARVTSKNNTLIEFNNICEYDYMKCMANDKNDYKDADCKTGNLLVT